MIKASICTIGDEILIGQIVDTNSSHFAKALNSIGVIVTSMVSTSDNEQEIEKTLNSLAVENDVIIITGGLGPTKDDITKSTLGKLTGATGTYQSKEQLDILSNILKSRGIALSDINIAQSIVPNTCKVIPNHRGTAPNMQFEIPASKYGHSVLMFSLPGVPFEAIAAIEPVMDSIKEHFNLQNITHRTICTFGIPESTLAKMIESWENNLPKELHLAYLPDPLLGVRLRLSAYGVNKDVAEVAIDREIPKLKELIGNAIYGYGEYSLPLCLRDIITKQGKTMSVAESCTGGFLSHMLTSVPGASEYFYGGVVSYDNSVKINVLNVRREIIEKYGAVSRECAEAMALGVKNLMKTDYAIATTGIAGPGGGTDEKPVGLVWVGIASDKGVLSTSFRFVASREINIERFASHAINYFREKCLL